MPISLMAVRVNIYSCTISENTTVSGLAAPPQQFRLVADSNPQFCKDIVSNFTYCSSKCPVDILLETDTQDCDD